MVRGGQALKVRVGDSGVVQYTGRAFNQDAQEAMGGDIVRALIELLTNSDDAYESVDGSGIGKINIVIDRSRGREWTAAVRDSRRGNLGRGAKDVAAFGEVAFESIKDNRYGKLLLRSDGSYSVAADHKVTEEERSGLGIPRGTVRSSRFESTRASSVRCTRL